MVWSPATHWKPTRLLKVAASVDTSTGATEVNTDAGRAYIKPMGNRQGPHVLATDWVGTHLASWFGLSTFDIAILVLGANDTFALPRGHNAEPGPAFATRALVGDPWDRSDLQLDLLVNPEDLTRLVVFDTWTLNCDRHYYDTAVRRPNYDNVFLASEAVEVGKRRLIAMDHGLCFIRSDEDLTTKLANIEKVRDEHVFGLFPQFHRRLNESTIEICASRLREMDVATAGNVVESVPKEWEVPAEVRNAWSDLIYRRASFVADNIQAWIERELPWFRSAGE